MKALKLSALAAIIAVAGVYAANAGNARALKNFRFDGTAAQQNNANLYTVINTPSQEPTCPGGAVNCKVQAQEDPSNPGHPIISTIVVLGQKLN